MVPIPRPSSHQHFPASDRPGPTEAGIFSNRPITKELHSVTPEKLGCCVLLFYHCTDGTENSLLGGHFKDSQPGRDSIIEEEMFVKKTWALWSLVLSPHIFSWLPAIDMRAWPSISMLYLLAVHTEDQKIFAGNMKYQTFCWALGRWLSKTDANRCSPHNQSQSLNELP